MGSAARTVSSSGARLPLALPQIGPRPHQPKQSKRNHTREPAIGERHRQARRRVAGEVALELVTARRDGGVIMKGRQEQGAIEPVHAPAETGEALVDILLVEQGIEAGGFVG